MLLNLHTSPMMEHLIKYSDNNETNTVLNFLEMLIQKQREQIVMNKRVQFNLRRESLELSIMTRKSNLNQSIDSGIVTFTAEGRSRMQQNNPFIPKISANLININLKTSTRVSHQRDVNNVINYLNGHHNNDSIRVDYEQNKTRA